MLLNCGTASSLYVQNYMISLDITSAENYYMKGNFTIIIIVIRKVA